MAKTFLIALIHCLTILAAVGAPSSTPAPNTGGRERFRLIFQAYDGDPKEVKGMLFQINTIDIRQPSDFLKIGDSIPRTKLKLLKFEYKTVRHANTGEDEDVSTLTLIDTETSETTVLPITKVVNVPGARKDP